MTITITGELEEKLREIAVQEGHKPDQVAKRLINSGLDWEELDRQDTILGIQIGIESNDAGRVKSLEQVISEARAKYGFPQSWPRDTEAVPENRK